MTEGQRPRGSREPLCTAYDVALLDLDGVVYLGGTAIPGAAEALRKAAAAGMRLTYVTNNAFRTPAAIAALLTSFGAPAAPEDVVTSAQAAARLLAERLPPGAPVLVIGGSGLRMAVRERGLRPVSTAAEQPRAVVQGYSPDVSYSMLAEGGLAVAAGALFVASNGDLTLPSRRGRQPGNGSLIQVVATATGVQPLVAGKPEPPLHRESVLRTGARHPLVVGDRLDTDIEGAHRVGTDSMLVLTGVTGRPKPSSRRRRSAPPTWPRTWPACSSPSRRSPEQTARSAAGAGRPAQAETKGTTWCWTAAASASTACARCAPPPGPRAARKPSVPRRPGPRFSASNGNRYLDVTTCGHAPCMLSGMPGRAVRRDGAHPGTAVMLARALCPSCCC